MVEVGIEVGVEEETDGEQEEEQEEGVVVDRDEAGMDVDTGVEVMEQGVVEQVDVEVAALDVETEAGEGECCAAALGEAEEGLDAASCLAGWVEVLDSRGPLPEEGALEGGSADVTAAALEAGWARQVRLALPDWETIARAP